MIPLQKLRYLLRRSAGWLGVAVATVTVAPSPGCKSGEVTPTKRQSSTRPASAQAPAAPAAAPPLLAPAQGDPDVTIQPNPHGLVIADRNGKETVRVDTSSGKPPEGWPTEVPLYPRGKVQMSMKLGRGATLTLETPDPLAKVIEYYETQLASMPQSNTLTTGKNHTRVWSDPSKPLQVTATLSEEAGKTRATLIVTRERGQ